MVTIEDFSRLEFKVGTVLEAEELEGSDKLLKLTVDLGTKLEPAGQDQPDGETGETAEGLEQSVEEKDIRTILSGIKQWYKPEDIKGKQFVFITNLAPRKMMGIESQGMIMAAEGDGKPVPLVPSEPVSAGSKIR